MRAVAWDRLLLDEAQDVKNPATKRARSLRRISARRRVAMTGTPIENRLSELWAIMDIVNPGLLGSRDWFERTFARPIEAFGDDRALERLRSIVQPFILRRAKDSEEVELELPPITIEKDYCRLTVEQAALYRATVDRWMPRIEDHADTFGRRGAVLAMLGQLKQLCNHPEMLVATGRALDGRSGKLERLLELLEDVPSGDKSLVFTQYPGFDRLVPHLEERLGKRVGFFHGRLNARQRDELVTSFASADGPEVLVISIKAGGRGLNLPAANHVFHFDRWWNPAVEQQATDRAYRFGQRKHVFVHSLICTGTLEERIDQLLDSKRELAAEGHRRPLRGLARRSRSRRDPCGGCARTRSRGGRGMSGEILNDGRPVVVTSERSRIGEGPWARLFATAVVPDEGSSSAELGRALARGGNVHTVSVTEGTLTADVHTGISGDHHVTIAAAPVSPRVWSAMSRFARGNRVLEAGVEGREQSVHLEHLLLEDWSEPLVPRTDAIACACTCGIRACEHLAALAYVIANEIDRDPSLLLRWRGCSDVRSEDASAEAAPPVPAPVPAVEPPVVTAPAGDPLARRARSRRFIPRGRSRSAP